MNAKMKNSILVNIKYNYNNLGDVFEITRGCSMVTTLDRNSLKNHSFCKEILKKEFDAIKNHNLNLQHHVFFIACISDKAYEDLKKLQGYW